MLLKIIMTAALALSVTAHAEETNQTLRELAQKNLLENPSSNSSQNFSSGLSQAQAQGLLQLEDPFEGENARNFLWMFGVSFRQYKPEGQAQLSTGVSYDISDAGSTVLPSLSLGSLYNVGQGKAGAWQVGINGELSYIQQKISLNTDITQLDGRLNTAMIEGQLITRWGPNLSSPWRIHAGYGRGHATLTQSSSSSVGQWSKSGQFQSWLIGADYAVSKKTIVGIQSRTLAVLNGSSGFSLPKNHLEGGVKVLW